MPDNRTIFNPALTRRGILTGAAGALAAAGLGIEPATAGYHNAALVGSASRLPRVQPLWSQALLERYAVCAHPHFMNTTYQHTAIWMRNLNSIHAHAFRGMYSPNSRSLQQVIDRCRRLGIKWIATVVPESWVSPSEVTARINHMAKHAADVVIAVEGMNEPNHDRDSGAAPSDWAHRAVAVQKALYQAVQSHPRLSHVEVVGPSLHDAVDTAQTDYSRLRAAGVLNYMDVCGLHCYPGGRKPDGEGKLAERLRWIRSAYGNVPVWVTETGYHNAMNDPDGHRPTPEDVAAVYAPRALLEMARSRVRRMVRYELLDDPNRRNDDQQAAFGLWRTPSIAPRYWTPKPEVAVMREFLGSLRDEGRAYTPPTVGLEVQSSTADVKWLVTAKRDGAAQLWLYRDVSIWDRRTRRREYPRAAYVTVRSRSGQRNIRVGPNVRSIAF